MNHLLIGLGGTGGRIIRAFRRRIHTEFRDGKPGGENLAYLYVDASAEMMAPADPSWKGLGASFQLPPADQLKIDARGLVARFETMDFSGIKPWIGDKDVWNDILGSVAGGSLSGQKRRLGRFLFACHAEQFRAKAKSQVEHLQKHGPGPVTFHVLAGLAGGTGSGSIVDTIAQLRTMYEDPARYRILLYLHLPEQLPDPAWDLGNYHANGYAALAELNALSVSALHPWDVTGQRERLLVPDPFAGAYLFDNETETGDRADVEEEMPAIAADFLFSKIVVAGQASWPALERLERAENGDSGSELSPATRQAERSRRFMSFGIKRVAVPGEEIAEYLSLRFAEQTIQQLRFNNWKDGAGYVDRTRDADLTAYVRRPEVRDRWRIGDEHLVLSTAILPTDDPGKRWRSIEEEWSSILMPLKTVVREQKRSLWLHEMARLIEKRFNEDYRGVGVEAFYRARLEAKQEMAREIRSLIERDLFDDWRAGHRSMAEVGDIVDAVIEDLARRQARCDDEAEHYLEAAQDHANQVEDVWQASLETSVLAKAFLGKSHQLLDTCAANIIKKRTAQTRALAWGFAKEFIGDILAELAELRAAVGAVLDELGDALDQVQARIGERTKGQTSEDVHASVVRVYDPEAVQATVRRLSLDKTIQKTQAASLRQAVADRLAGGRLFDAARQALRGSELLDMVLVNAEASAIHAHQTLVAGTKERILGVSIVETLKQRYGADQPALNAFVADLVGHSGPFLRLDPMEVERVGPGIPASAQTPAARLIVALPKAPHHAEFMAMLKQAFWQAQPGELEFVETSDRGNEIAILSVRNLLPARYAAIVGLLRDRYRQRIAEDPKRFAQELHTEGDGSQLPDLFAPVTGGARDTRYRMVVDGGKQTVRQLRGV